MGMLDFSQPNEISKPRKPEGLKETVSGLDAAFSEIEATALNRSSQTIKRFWGDYRNNRKKDYEKIIGYNQTFSDTLANPWFSKLERDVGKEFPEAAYIMESESGLVKLDDGRVVGVEEALDKYIDLFIQKKRIEDPEKYKDLKTKAEIEEDYEKMVKQAEIQAAEDKAKSPNDLLQNTISFGGQAIRLGLDKENLAASVIGSAMAPVGLGALGRLSFATIENMAAEALVFPEIQKHQEMLGREHGLPELWNDMKAAAVGTVLLFGLGKTTAKVGAPVVKAANTGLSKAAQWIDIRTKLRKLGLGKAADEADTLKFLAEQSELDVSGRVISKAENERAIREVAKAMEENRPIDKTKLPDESKFLEKSFLNGIKDPVLKAEIEKLQKIYEEADSPDAPGATADAPPAGKTPEDLASESNLIEKIDPEDYTQQAKVALEQARLVEGLNKMESVFKSNKDWTMKIGDEQVDAKGFKKALETVDKIAKIVSKCGV